MEKSQYDDDQREQQRKKLSVQSSYPKLERAESALIYRRPSTSTTPGCSETKLKLALAATAAALNARLLSADMPPTMQERALRFTTSLFDRQAATANPNRPNSTLIARALKKAATSLSLSLLNFWEFDSVYGPAWHCVVGKSFGSFVTHSPSGFIYFSLDSFSLLLFQTAVRLVNEPASG
ncbi:uncharacterized protein LOC131163499 isoform X1 [Malania oleifera]|uniref:uncharacterized protein LOC131163499 isoform X1 n=1 Tax=Malania oleifera TaxID=397392 RepID=UPI0025AE37D5|nr:uncharacterized protein LOC131163499 isoform X1 [Malania oleifera]